MKKIITLYIFSFAIALHADITMKPYLMGVTKNSVYVLVECNSTSTVTVEYGQTTGYGTSATTESYLPQTTAYDENTSYGHRYVHKIKLTLPLPGTVYHYRARQGSTFQADYPDAYFTTAPEKGSSFWFAWEADMRNDSIYTSPPNHDNRAIHEAISALINNANPVFLLQGGDVCQFPTYYKYKNEFFLVNGPNLPSKELELISHVPFFWTPGPDHDIAHSGDVITDATNFKAFSTNPNNNLDDTFYYSFDYGDLHVLVLNSVLPFGIGTAQYNYAMSDLSGNTQKWKIVIAHIPAYVGRLSDPPGTNYEDQNMIDMTNNIFVPNGVDLVITGHHHMYQHNYKDGLHHIIIGTAGAPLYNPLPEDQKKPYTIMSAKNYCFGIFNLTPNSLTLKVYNLSNTQIDELTLTKSDEWTAYNDMAWGSGQLEPNLPSASRKYITRITSPNGGSGLLSSGYLMDYTNGTFTGVKLTVTGGSFDGSTHASHGQESPPGDAAIFNGKISPRGAISYETGNLELELSGMNPEKLYEVMFYADRGDHGWVRASKVKIDCGSSDDGGAFLNQSSDGTDDNVPPNPLFSGPTDDDTKLPANNINGYVARFTNISSGDDGIIKLIVSFAGTDAESRGKYASALMVKQLEETDHTITVEKWGQGTVTKSPDQSTYAHGDNVVLTATPSSGWQFLGWRRDLNGSENPKTINMNSHKVVTAIFKPVPNWTAYNDLAWNTGQLENRITKFTSPNGQLGNDNDNDGILLKYSDGSGTGVNLNITGGYYDRTTDQSTHGRTPANGDGVIFEDKVNTLGSISYSDPRSDLVLTFTGLNNDKYYYIGFYADRNDYVWTRASLVTISDVVSFDNISSFGRDNAGNLLCDGIGDYSTRLPSDNDPGYLARFANIRAGDGDVVITISFNGTDEQYRSNYASALIVEEYNQKLEPVPVELTSFIASLQGRNVNLVWKTATEVNSYGFEVERQVGSRQSAVGKWNKIGFVQGSGNSNSPKDYSFIDTKLNAGKYSYRLKMIDNDGTYEYSDVAEIEVGLPKEYAISQNYPNPFNPTTRIDYQLPLDSKVTIELYGITGERVATLVNNVLSAGYYTADVNANVLNLASGVYICRMIAQDQSKYNTNTFIQIKKLMLMK